MSETIFNYRKLIVWQKARELAREVYACTRKSCFVKDGRFLTKRDFAVEH